MIPLFKFLVIPRDSHNKPKNIYLSCIWLSLPLFKEMIFFDLFAMRRKNKMILEKRLPFINN